MRFVMKAFGAMGVALGAGLCLFSVWMIADDMFLQPRAIVEGVVAEKGTEYVSLGRGGSNRLLLTVEGQPYVFFRQIGWFDTRQGMLNAVEVGRPVSMRVLELDLAAEEERAPDDRRIHIIALEQDGKVVFSEFALQWPRMLALLAIALVGLLTLLLLLLWLFVPGRLSERDAGPPARAD